MTMNTNSNRRLAQGAAHIELLLRLAEQLASAADDARAAAKALRRECSTPLPAGGGAEASAASRSLLGEVTSLHQEIDRLSTAMTVSEPEALCALAVRARAIRDLCPELARPVGVALRRLARVAAKRGFHLDGLRRSNTRGVSARRATPPSSRVVSCGPETEPDPPTLRSAPAPVVYFEAVPRRRKAPPVIVLGGELEGRVASVAAELAVDLEWVRTTKANLRPIEALVCRVRDGSVSGLIILNAFISHRHGTPVVDVARAKGVPVVYAGRGGARRLRDALVELEARGAVRLTRRAS